MSDEAQTWHYGLVARYWAEHNTSGPEIPYYQKKIGTYGEPVLDAGCGTGRLLIPFLQAGLDVDGCDVSADMLAFCKERAEKEGLAARLYQQALHELQLPRTYQTIVSCGVFGLGASRQEDTLALQRLYQHLRPGGTLLLDHEMPYTDAREWSMWHSDARRNLPERWPEEIGTRPPEDGSEYELHSRVLAMNPLEQQITREMRALLWRDGQVAGQERYTLTENRYFCNQLCQMLEGAGFEVEAVQGDYTETDANPDHNFLVFIAHKPGQTTERGK